MKKYLLTVLKYFTVAVVNSSISSSSSSSNSSSNWASNLLHEQNARWVPFIIHADTCSHACFLTKTLSPAHFSLFAVTKINNNYKFLQSSHVLQSVSLLTHFCLMLWETFSLFQWTQAKSKVWSKCVEIRKKKSGCNSRVSRVNVPNSLFPDDLSVTAHLLPLNNCQTECTFPRWCLAFQITVNYK